MNCLPHNQCSGQYIKFGSLICCPIGYEVYSLADNSVDATNCTEKNWL